MRIGLLSDTHLPGERRSLWDEVRSAFESVDLILHAGDVVRPMVLDWLEDIAPVLAAEGNNDLEWDDPRMSPIQILDVEGWRVAMVHDMEPEERPIDYLTRTYLRSERADVIVTGHTHLERLDYREGVLQINPGSATLPHLQSTRLGTVGFLEVASGRLEAWIVRLGHSERRPNPGREYTFDPVRGVRILDR